MTTQIPASLIPKIVSAEQTITGNANATIGHGLGRLPDDLEIVIRCKTAELGYAIGDEVTIAGGGYNATNQVNVTRNTTNIIITTLSSSAIQVVQKALLSSANPITPANWRYVAKYR